MVFRIVRGLISLNNENQRQQAAELGKRLTGLGYEAEVQEDAVSLTKPAKIESVVSELVQVCEPMGWDFWKDCDLAEYEQTNGKVRSYYRFGRVHRDDES